MYALISSLCTPVASSLDRPSTRGGWSRWRGGGGTTVSGTSGGVLENFRTNEIANIARVRPMGKYERYRARAKVHGQTMTIARFTCTVRNGNGRWACGYFQSLNGNKIKNSRFVPRVLWRAEKSIFRQKIDAGLKTTKACDERWSFGAGTNVDGRRGQSRIDSIRRRQRPGTPLFVIIVIIIIVVITIIIIIAAGANGARYNFILIPTATSGSHGRRADSSIKNT